MYESPTVVELGSVADFTQGRGTDFQYDGGFDFFSDRNGGGGGTS